MIVVHSASTLVGRGGRVVKTSDSQSEDCGSTPSDYQVSRKQSWGITVRTNPTPRPTLGTVNEKQLSLRK